MLENGISISPYARRSDRGEDSELMHSGVEERRGREKGACYPLSARENRRRMSSRKNEGGKKKKKKKSLMSQG